MSAICYCLSRSVSACISLLQVSFSLSNPLWVSVSSQFVCLRSLYLSIIHTGWPEVWRCPNMCVCAEYNKPTKNSVTCLHKQKWRGIICYTTSLWKQLRYVRLFSRNCWQCEPTLSTGNRLACRNLMERGVHGLINFIDAKAKCRHLKKWPVHKGTSRQVFICLRPSPLIWPHTPPLHTVYCMSKLYTYSQVRGGGEMNQREGTVRGTTVHKAGSKIPTWLTVSPVYKFW